MQIRTLPCFSHVHFCIKKFSPCHFRTARPRKKTSRALLSAPEGGRDRENNVPICGVSRCSVFLLHRNTRCARMWHRGVVEAHRGCPGCFFLSPLLGARRRRRGKGGVQGALPELHQDGNTLWTERKTAGTRGRGNTGREGGGNDPYGTPNGTDFSRRRKM